jgi:hypothetical protein
MKPPSCRPAALAALGILAVLQISGCAGRKAVELPPVPSMEEGTLRARIEKSYLDLFQSSTTATATAAELQTERDKLEKGEKACVARFRDDAREYSKQIDAAQKNLKNTSAKLTDAQRNQIHCQIQNLDLMQRQSEMLAQHAIPTAYDNLQAKLDLVEKWPGIYRQIQEEIADESYVNRRWGDVKDIGFREIAAHQEDDIKRGQEAIEEMKRTGLLPAELDNKKINDYVDSVAQKVARNSDLKVPLHVTVLQSSEINAFALPGGYLFIQRGLLEAVDNESQLAGVMSHEIGHITARHGYKLMKRATIASIFYQAAQVAALIATGGAVGPGLYYALQYGFYSLGLVLDLNLLGVSRDYELQADQLGVQYAWNSGYDPAGFIQFFDKMATREGYVTGASWFRTHPPFFERMVDTEKEIMFLPPKSAVVTQTEAFEEMKKELVPVAAQAEKEEKDKPRLRMTPAEGCPAPPKLEVAGQPVEQLCASPRISITNTGAVSTSSQ